jgi:hypothetical protein
MKKLAISKLRLPQVINSPVLLVALAVSLALVSGVSSSKSPVASPTHVNTSRSGQSLLLQKTQATSDSATADGSADASPDGISTAPAPQNALDSSDASTTYSISTNDSTSSGSATTSTGTSTAPTCTSFGTCTAPIPTPTPTPGCNTCIPRASYYCPMYMCAEPH